MQTIKSEVCSLEENKRQFRGFAHCHSRYSYDGQCSYAELRELFRNKNLDFVCITEHIEYLDQDKIDSIIRDCRKNSDSEFLFIPGIEMDEFVVYFIGMEQAKIDFSSSRKIFDSLLSVSKLCIFSHPIKAKYQYPEWLIKCCDGVEVWNTKHDGIHYLRKQSLKLLEQVRKIRPNAMPLVGMDFHNKAHLSPANIQLINCGPLTEDFVVNEIKQGQFKICKDNREINHASLIEREYYWLRIAMMDKAHGLHSYLNKQGFVVPRSIKRVFRKIMEGK